MRLYSTYVHKGTKGDMVLKIFYFFQNYFYFVALMLTALLRAEFALVFVVQTALTL